ncbi:MAG: NAD(P)/FAD-dependent oxidoreductase [Chlamydiia bacterium]|nr:NAD(P)/FAD-dependent oxidoreductase [Chlamydiia bacterium]
MPSMRRTIGLQELEGRVRDDLRFLGYHPNNWQTARRGKNGLYQVVIIGGGMAGMAAAFALLKVGIFNIVMVDQQPAGKEGPWDTYARMKALRTSKKWIGPSVGMPSLTFQSWYEAQFGSFAWELLRKIPTHLWMEYLSWFKKMLKFPLQNDTKLISITREEEYLKLELSNGTIITEKLVLATGLNGFGGYIIPDFMQHVPKSHWAHTNEQIDFAALQGKRIAIIGGGDAGLDAAGTALEQGAKSVDLHIRRKALPVENVTIGSNFVLSNGEYGLCSDDEKDEIFRYIFDTGLSPPNESLLRVEKFPNFKLHTETDFEKILKNFDFYILATGPAIDGSKQPEIAPFNDQVLHWGDQGYNHPKVAKFPYLGKYFEFLEKEKGAAPFLKDIHCFNHASVISHGGLGSGIALIGVGAQLLAQGIRNDSFIKTTKNEYLSMFRSKISHSLEELEYQLPQ